MKERISLLTYEDIRYYIYSFISADISKLLLQNLILFLTFMLWDVYK